MGKAGMEWLEMVSNRPGGFGRYELARTDEMGKGCVWLGKAGWDCLGTEWTERDWNRLAGAEGMKR